MGSNTHTLQTHPLSLPKRAREDILYTSQVQECPLQYLSSLPNRQSHTALNACRWPMTRAHIRSPPRFHSRVVTQQGSWLVMEPVSHPASINLTPHPSAQLEPPPLSDQMVRRKRQGRGPARGLGGQRAKLEPYFIHTLLRPSVFQEHTRIHEVVCKHVQMHVYTLSNTQTHTWLHTYGLVKSHYWYFNHDKYVELHGLRICRSSTTSFSA